MKLLSISLLFLALAPALAADDRTSRERMRADLEFLCSPPLEGRASLSRGADATAWFIATEMRKAGLQPAAGAGFLQRFDVVPLRIDRERSSVRVMRDGKEQRFSPGAVFLPDPARPVDLTLDVVFAGYGITAPDLGYDDYAGIDVRGKAVLVFDHEPQEANPRSAFHGTGFTLHANTWTKSWNAQRHGAAALLVVTEPVNSHRVAPRAPDRANAPPQALARSELGIPRIGVPPEAAAALLEGTGRTPVEWQGDVDRGPSPASRPLDGVRVRLLAVNGEAAAQASWNVAGLLPGTDAKLRDETILVSAHYDHLGVQNGKLYAGANDNASGVAGMLEAARLLGTQPLARSVLFLAFGSEEQLMLGSYHYVAHPLRPLDKTIAVLNLDMIGRNEEHTPESAGAYDLTASRADQVNLVGAVFSQDLEELLIREAKRAGTSLSAKFDRDSSMRALFRCDHLPFLQKGIPAVWLFGGFHPGYHEPADTIDRLDFDKMTRVVQLTADAVRALAASRTAPRFGRARSSQP
ncbi:MAG TPA: M20/M25/M40 family metallo-hydrolase [Vicinamibacterales bacterium]|nr:M20/M25/M40 family metallo-hydrolase [Vicinamibacterales bacterium]